MPTKCNESVAAFLEEKQETSAELLAEAKEKLKDLRGQSTALQHRSTQELIQRVKDVGLWKAELERLSNK